MPTPYLNEFELLQKQIDMSKKMQTILIIVGISILVLFIATALWLLLQFGGFQDQQQKGGKRGAASSLTRRLIMINGKASFVGGRPGMVNVQYAACSPAGGIILLPTLSKKSIFVRAAISRPFENGQSSVSFGTVIRARGCLFYAPSFLGQISISKPIPRLRAANEFIEAFTKVFRCKNCYDRVIGLSDSLVVVT